MTYNAYRFDHSRPDANSPAGKRETIYVAVAQSYEEAAKLVFDIASDPTGLRFVGHGGQLLAEARKAGIADGAAGIL